MPFGLVVTNASKMRGSIVRVDAGAGIAHRYLGLLVVDASAADHHLPLVRGLVVHGLDGVERQVQDDLLHLHPIGADLRQPWFEFGAERHALGRRFGSQHLHRLADGLVQIQLLDVGRGLAQHVADPHEDFAGTLVVQLDVIQDLGHFVQVGWIGLDQKLRGTGIVVDRAEGLIELVGNRRGKPAHGHAAIHVRHRRQARLRLGLGNAAAAALREQRERSAMTGRRGSPAPGQSATGTGAKADGPRSERRIRSADVARRATSAAAHARQRHIGSAHWIWPASGTCRRRPHAPAARPCARDPRRTPCCRRQHRSRHRSRKGHRSARPTRRSWHAAPREAGTVDRLGRETG